MNYPTHSIEISKGRTVRTDWGTFKSDAEAIGSARSRKLARGLKLVRVISNGSVIWEAGQ